MTAFDHDRKALREALTAFGHHADDCEYALTVCTCGFTEAMRTLFDAAHVPPTPALTAARLAALEGALRAIVSELERFWEHGEECPVWATDDVTDEPMYPGDIPARHEACDCGIAVLLGKADAALATLPAPAAEVEG